jgi:hypothetical protein
MLHCKAKVWAVTQSPTEQPALSVAFFLVPGRKPGLVGCPRASISELPALAAWGATILITV